MGSGVKMKIWHPGGEKEKLETSHNNVRSGMSLTYLPPQDRPHKNSGSSGGNVIHKA